MKNVFGVFGVLFLLKQAEAIFKFYSLAFTDVAKIDMWTATQGVLATAIIGYLLYTLIKFAVKVINFWYNPDPNAEIEL
ncbi:MAG: hypothetical protein EOO47_25430 [Flavobacterium sp.]|nr:MAG: hypothetical protein EOO47_25430 [Flavobacterium sp.]